MDSTIASGNKFVYVYTLINFSATALPEGYQDISHNNLTNTICSDQGLSEFSNRGTIFKHKFKNNKGTHIAEVVIPAHTCDKLAKKAISTSDAIPDEELFLGIKEYVDTMRQGLPMRVDADTRLDEVTAPPIKKEICYKYTLIKYTAEEFEHLRVRFKDEMKKKIVKKYCTNPDMTILRDNNIKLSNNYMGKDGKDITKIEVDNSLCR
jgi:hypothetical protein